MDESQSFLWDIPDLPSHAKHHSAVRPLLLLRHISTHPFSPFIHLLLSGICRGTHWVGRYPLSSHWPQSWPICMKAFLQVTRLMTCSMQIRSIECSRGYHSPDFVDESNVTIDVCCFNLAIDRFSDYIPAETSRITRCLGPSHLPKFQLCSFCSLQLFLSTERI